MKITNVKVGVELNDLLSDHPVFAGENYKLISPCQHFLHRINEIRTLHECEFVSYHSREIKKIFRKHNRPYKCFLDALIEKKLLEINQCYFNDAKNPQFNRCNEYKVTELGKRLLRAEVTEYLRKLHNDPQRKRNTQKNRSKKRRKSVPTGDIVVDSTTKFLRDLRYCPEQVEEIMAKPDFTQGAKDNVLYSLLRFQTGDFRRVERNPKDGRIHYEWVQMKSDARAAFFLPGRIRTHTVDIRGCHPTFLATYIYEHCVPRRNPRQNHGESTSEVRPEITAGTPVTGGGDGKVGGEGGISSLIILPHYVGVDGDIWAAERNRWVAFWTRTDADPRDLIARKIGINRDCVKQFINSALNGSENRLFKWFQANNPALFSAWIATDIKKTGNEISKWYESDILLNPDFVQLAENSDLRIGLEHDGFSVFAKPDDKGLKGKLDMLVKYLQDYSSRRHGVPIVLKVEDECARN